MYDLLIKAGRIIDPANQTDTQADIAIAGGQIAAISSDIPREQAEQVVDATGKLVTPGLIDIHIHAAEHEDTDNVHPDIVGIKMGVTTVVDTGSAGIIGFPGYRKLVEQSCKTRIYFIPVTSLVYEFVGDYIALKVGADISPKNFSLKKTQALYEKHKDVIVGFKCIAPKIQESDVESIPLTQSKQITRAIGVPLTVHLGWVPYRPWLEIPLVMEQLDAGDIATHIFRRKGSILDANQKVFSEVFEAQERGVRFDIGHGNGNFNFDVAKRAIDQGIRPFTISTDIMDRNSIMGPVFSLAKTMTKFLYLGFSLYEVVEMVTYHAALAINKTDELGCISVGRVADLSILDYQHGDWKLSDGINTVVWDGPKLIPQFTVAKGKIIPCEFPENSFRKEKMITLR
ncbi:MAG: amidohydrolase family protein [Nodosilinea sp.]